MEIAHVQERGGKYGVIRLTGIYSHDQEETIFGAIGSTIKVPWVSLILQCEVYPSLGLPFF
jgi:hypothetical protein